MSSFFGRSFHTKVIMWMIIIVQDPFLFNLTFDGVFSYPYISFGGGGGLDFGDFFAW